MIFMGFINLMKNAYRKFTGQLSSEDERKYRGWSGYNGKISRASKEENLTVNLELQRRVYESERLKRVTINEEFNTPLEKYVTNYYFDVPLRSQEKIYHSLESDLNNLNEKYSSLGAEILDLQLALERAKNKERKNEEFIKRTERRLIFKQKRLEILTEAA